MTDDDAPEYRAEFSASVTFSNGGSLSVEGFRVDVDGPDVTAERVGSLFVASLGLLMTERVEVDALRLVEEPHKGTRGGPADRSSGPRTDGPARIVELSHPVDAGMTTVDGLPGPVMEPHLTRADSRALYSAGTEFAIDRISMVGNTGTSIDSPHHRFDDGADLASMALRSFADLPTIVVRTGGSGSRAVDVGSVAGFDVRRRAVLLHTGHDAAWRTDRYSDDAPHLTERAASWLVDHGAALVGIDSVNVDDLADPSRPAHTILLGAGIPVVEHLTGLGQLPVHGARFTAAPPRLVRFGTFPVRAFAVLP